MSKINIIILAAAAVLLSGCGGHKEPIIPVPIKEEQMGKVYKFYNSKHFRHFKYDEKMRDAISDALCENDFCKQNFAKKADITYIYKMRDGNLKFLHSTTDEDEATEILRLKEQKPTSYDWGIDQSTRSMYYRLNYDIGFRINRNGDFVNSEFLTLQDRKVTDRKFIEHTEATMLYDKNGSKLLDKAHQNIYFYHQKCNKVLVIDGLKYETLPIAAHGKYIDLPRVTIDKDVKRFSNTKFYLDNKNSSNIEIFAPFGYMIEYGNAVTKAYYFFDENGKELFDEVKLEKLKKINDHRFLAHITNLNTNKSETLLYDFDNRKILLKANRIEPSLEPSITTYDKLVFLKDKKMGIADFDGNIVVDLQDKYRFESTYGGVIVYAKGAGLYNMGLLDMQLNLIIKDLFRVDFKDDIFIAYAKDRVVVFDYSKNILQDLKANRVTVYNDFYLSNLKDEYTVYDKKWNKIFDKPYKITPLGNNTFSYTLDGKTAVMDINAKEIIPPICDSVKLGQCGVIECLMK
jgi:hypothetical protein